MTHSITSDAEGRKNPCAWVTLITRTSYLPGTVLLAHSLFKVRSAYPLLVLVTETVPSDVLDLLQKELTLTNATIRKVDPLLPKEEIEQHIAQRFKDTWTKLRVFELIEYQRLIFLDSDMLILQNMDELFRFELHCEEGLAATHACVCNLDRDSWAPEDWIAENCAYTGLTYPEALTQPCPVPQPNTGKRTHTLLNSGLFIFNPSPLLWSQVLHYLDTSPLIKTFMFPDQDFLAHLFQGRWTSLSYRYNAIKTMRYWHPAMWRDEAVKNLHYIVDKPWSQRVGKDGKAGYLGRDGVTHQWWWDKYEEWLEERTRAGEEEIITLVNSEVAGPVTGEDEGGKALHGDWKAVGTK